MRSSDIKKVLEDKDGCGGKDNQYCAGYGLSICVRLAAL